MMKTVKDSFRSSSLFCKHYLKCHPAKSRAAVLAGEVCVADDGCDPQLLRVDVGTDHRQSGRALDHSFKLRTQAILDK